MGIRVGMVGVGAFAQPFIPLFLAHPLVDEVAFCDLDETRLEEVAAKFGVKRTYPSLDALCESDLDAAVIITQNWLHGPQAVQALRAGKHVYSAVPTGITVDGDRGAGWDGGGDRAHLHAGGDELLLPGGDLLPAAVRERGFRANGLRRGRVLPRLGSRPLRGHAAPRRASAGGRRPAVRRCTTRPTRPARSSR